MDPPSPWSVGAWREHGRARSPGTPCGHLTPAAGSVITLARPPAQAALHKATQVLSFRRWCGGSLERARQRPKDAPPGLSTRTLPPQSVGYHLSPLRPVSLDRGSGSSLSGFSHDLTRGVRLLAAILSRSTASKLQASSACLSRFSRLAIGSLPSAHGAGAPGL
jgi:hypothetical protein